MKSLKCGRVFYAAKISCIILLYLFIGELEIGVLSKSRAQGVDYAIHLSGINQYLRSVGASQSFLSYPIAAYSLGALISYRISNSVLCTV